MRLWRISNHVDLTGLGGLKASGRWHTRGRPVVYLAESPPGALLEVLVHLEVRQLASLPDRYTLLTIDTDAEVLHSGALGDDWREHMATTRALGDRWLKSGESALLRVPSVIMPGVWNVLLNPLHRDAVNVRIVASDSLPFDRRLFKIVRD